MRGILMAAGLAVAGLAGMTGAARAAVMTFDDLPDEGAQLQTWIEDGIVASSGSSGPGALAYWRQPGRLLLTDSGTGFASFVSFRLVSGERFDALSFVINPMGADFVACVEVPEGSQICEPRGFDNVEVLGWRDGTGLVRLAFDMFEAGPVVELGSEFRRLNWLLLTFTVPPFGDLGDGTFGECQDSPCSSYEVDDVTLVPAPVPLPATAALLAGALAGLAGLRWRRRGAS